MNWGKSELEQAGRLPSGGMVRCSALCPSEEGKQVTESSVSTGPGIGLLAHVMADLECVRGRCP